MKKERNQHMKSKSTLIAAAVLALATSALPAFAQTKLRWAHVYETNEPYHTEAVWAAE